MNKAQVKSLRLVLRYEGKSVRLLSEQRVEILSLPSDPFPPEEGQAGFWYEVSDADGQTLYRRVSQNPIRVAAEIRTEDRERPLAWQDISEPRGEFVIIIPDFREAATLTLFSSPLEPDARSEPATEVARIDLTKVR